MFIRFLSLVGLVVCLNAAIAWAQAPFAPHASGDKATRYPQAEGAYPYPSRPQYLIPTSVETGAGATTWNAVLTRITGDAGASITHLSPSVWGKDGRHQYSSRSSWNATGSLLYIENGMCNDCVAAVDGEHCPKTSGGFNGYNGPADPKKLFLDGNTYIPQNIGQFTAITDAKELVWHPSTSWADYVIVVRDSLGSPPDAAHNRSLLQWVNVWNGAIARTWTLPFQVTGIGPGEGAPSNDGRFITLLDVAGDDVVLVDMDPSIPDPYPRRRISAASPLPQPCGLSCPASCIVGHVTVSSKGTFLDVAYGNDIHRIFDIDWKLTEQSAMPALGSPHTMHVTPSSCYDGALALDANGWIMPLKHADHLTCGDEEYIVGFDDCRVVGSCSSPGGLEPFAEDSGRVVVVKLTPGSLLQDGSVRHVSAGRLEVGSRERSGAHVSARNVSGQTSWVFASYDKTPGDLPTGNTRMMGEVVAWSLDRSATVPKAVKRFTWSHSAWSSALGYECYRAEMHPSPSPDGRRILFASNWRRWTQGVSDYAPNDWRKAYVIDTWPTPAAVSGLTAESTQGCAITLRWTAPKDDMLDPASGQVAGYDIRYNTTGEITPESFYDQAFVVPPSPLAPGSLQTLVVSGLDDTQTYYFAVRSIGTNGPRSTIVGPVTATPGPPPPHNPPFFCG